MPCILVIGDSNISLLEIECMLEMREYCVHVANNGSEALKMAQYIIVDLIIIDLHLPDKDTLSLINKFRKIEHIEFIHMIVMTDESKGNFDESYHRLGVYDRLVKPVTSKILLQNVHKALYSDE